jgi:hypothetical protein
LGCRRRLEKGHCMKLLHTLYIPNFLPPWPPQQTWKFFVWWYQILEWILYMSRTKIFIFVPDNSWNITVMWKCGI